jgi:hypothetical protein
MHVAWESARTMTRLQHVSSACWVLGPNLLGESDRPVEAMGSCKCWRMRWALHEMNVPDVFHQVMSVHKGGLWIVS